jgi:hypothetical protein
MAVSYPLHGAYELVEHQLITEADFRDFVFANPTRRHTAMNPHSSRVLW